MKEPLISVILPAYKAEKYISDALESIAYQTYSNWELIVVEDAWIDRTEIIVYEFANSLPKHRIQFHRHEKNCGLAATRNTAIRFCKGKYIAFLDHDDIWKPDHLKVAVKELEAQNADIAYSTVLMFQDGTNKELGFWGPKPEDIHNFPASLYDRNYITPSATLVKKTAVEAIGLFDEQLRSCEDYDCWIRMVKANFKFVYIKGTYCLYRKHASALTQNHKVMKETMLHVMKKHEDWSIIPRKVQLEKFATLYIQLGNLGKSEAHWKAVMLFLYAWLQQPTKFYYAKRLLKTIAFINFFYAKSLAKYWLHYLTSYSSNINFL